MKKLTLILSLTFGFATTSNAETWSCAYLRGGEAENIVFVREGNKFYRADKSDYDEIAGFSIWGGLWGNSGKIAPLNPKPASERTVNVKANQRELPEDLPF